MGTSKQQFISLSQMCPGRGASLTTNSKGSPGCDSLPLRQWELMRRWIWISSKGPVGFSCSLGFLTIYAPKQKDFLPFCLEDFCMDSNTSVKEVLLMFNMIHFQLTLFIPSSAIYSSPSKDENWTFPQSEGYCQVPYLVCLWQEWQRKGFNLIFKN